jgi:hypothetical protein
MDLVRDTRTGEKRRVARGVMVEEVFGVVATDDREETVHRAHLSNRPTHTITPSPRQQGFGVTADDCDRTTHTLTTLPRLPQGFGAVADDCEEAVLMDGTYPTTRITETLTIPLLTGTIGSLPHRVLAKVSPITTTRTLPNKHQQR